jgi:hypothetical protein
VDILECEEMNDTEEWRKIPGFSRYSVSSHGRIRRDEIVYRARPGFISVNYTGEIPYPRVYMTSDDGKYITARIHHIVARVFIGPRPEGMVVRHLDGNCRNNHFSNLAYGTHKDNVHDAIRHGTQVRGNKQHLAKLSDEDVLMMRELFDARIETAASLGRKFRISKSSAWAAVKRITWTHI